MLHKLRSQSGENHLKSMLHELNSQRGGGMAFMGVEEHIAQGN